MSAISCASYSRKTISKRRYHKIRILWSEDQAQSLYLARMFRAALHDIDPCCLHAGVAQRSASFADVLSPRRKTPGRRGGGSCGERPAWPPPRLGAEGSHLPPDVGPVQRPPCLGDKHRAGDNAPLPAVLPNVRHSLAVRRTRRPFPFPTQARPVCRAWTVTYCSSDTRTPL